MSAQAGRDLVVKMDISSTQTTIAGANSGTLTLNQSTVDITNKDSNAWRELLAGAGQNSGTISLQGVYLDESTIREVHTAWINQTSKDFEIVLPGTTGGAAGSYFVTGIITSLEWSGEEGGAVNYSMTVESSGEITFTDLA